LQEDRRYGDKDNQQHDLLEVMPDERDIAEPVSKADHRRYPANSANNVEGEKTNVVHLADARNEGGEGPDNRDELRVNDCLAAVPLIKRVGAVEIFTPENLRITPEKAVTDSRPEQESDPIARNRSNREEHDYHADLELASPGHNAYGKQQGISWKKETHQETALGEYHQEEQ
jgi:hypothetical protein